MIITYQSQLVLVQALSCPLEYQPYSALQAEKSNRCSAFKNNRLMTRLLTVCKRTNSLSTFVFVREKKLIKALVPKGFEKPFTIYYKVSSMRFADSSRWYYLHVRAGEPLECVKTESRVFNEHWPSYLRNKFSLVALPFAIVAGRIRRNSLQCPQLAYICLERSLQSSLESRAGQVTC